jgi:hypothetical protein
MNDRFPLSRKLLIKVCNNKRIKRNNVFKGIAELGKSTIGWFYGFKLHIVINDKGEILNFMITTGIKNNMKNNLLSMSDKILLRKRSVIETVNDELKNICQIKHSRHRSFANFIPNLIGGLIAYSFFPKKPSIAYQNVNSIQIAAF